MFRLTIKNRFLKKKYDKIVQLLLKKFDKIQIGRESGMLKASN